MNADKNRKEVARLFEKRTGVKYQNWIQALSVSQRPKRLALALLPKWIAILVMIIVLILISCAPHTAFTHSDYKGVEHTYLQSLSELPHATRTVWYCGKHTQWENITVVWNGDGYDYYISRSNKQ